MALTNIEKVRLNVGDTDVTFPFLSDDSYLYYLEKNNNNVDRASMDSARAILFQLSTRNAETVDIFTIKNTSADSYRNALTLYLTNPSLNPLINNLKGWFGGISRTEMLENDCNIDNNIVQSPNKDRYPLPTGPFTYTWRL